MRHWVSCCCCAALLSTIVSAQDNLDPCAEIEVGAEDGFVVGLAYWPGGTTEAWGNVTSELNPCSSSESGTESDWQVAAFRTKLDTIAVLQTSRSIETRMLDGARPPVLSVVAFAQGVRSEARYIRSTDTNQTDVEGIIENMILVATFDKGKLLFLRWENPRCSGCASSCMRTGTVYEGERTFACADKSVEECSCDSAPGPDCGNDADEPNACQTSIQFGASGTDKNSVVFNTGTQLQKIGSLSIVKLFGSVSDVDLGI